MRGDALEEETAELRRVIRDAQVELMAQVEAACSAIHRPIQHGDGRSPWCAFCHRYADGRKVDRSNL